MSYETFLSQIFDNTHSVVICLGHHVSNLRPAKSILDGDLIRGAPHVGSLDSATSSCHVAKDRAANTGLLFPVPSTTEVIKMYE